MQMKYYATYSKDKLGGGRVSGRRGSGRGVQGGEGQGWGNVPLQSPDRQKDNSYE